MRYVSDDGKVFYTEQECYDYEKKIERERAEQDKFEAERQEKVNVINEKYEELQNLIFEFEKKYVVKQKPYFAPVSELINMLCR